MIAYIDKTLILLSILIYKFKKRLGKRAKFVIKIKDYFNTIIGQIFRLKKFNQGSKIFLKVRLILGSLTFKRLGKECFQWC